MTPALVFSFENQKAWARIQAEGLKRLFVSLTGSIAIRAAGLAIIALLASSCATPIGVKHVDEETAYRKLDANILSSGEPSAYSTQLLERNALVGRYRNDPAQVLGELYSGLGKTDEHDRLFALAEIVVRPCGGD